MTDETRQMLVIAFHEFSHAITSCCTGGRVESISLDPHEGGVTHMRGGKQFITLPAGYLGSSLIGALLTFCGFNIVASKVASIVLGVCFLLTLWWARKDWLTIVTILLSVGLLVAFWFIEHGEALRFMVVSIFLCPFLGKRANSHASSFSSASCRLSTASGISATTSFFARSTRLMLASQCWGVIWSLVSLVFMVCGILAGLAAFKQSFEQQEKDSQDFIPTVRMMMRV
jgi:hypothetical protein